VNACNLYLNYSSDVTGFSHNKKLSKKHSSQVKGGVGGGGQGDFNAGMQKKIIMVSLCYQSSWWLTSETRTKHYTILYLKKVCLLMFRVTYWANGSSAGPGLGLGQSLLAQVSVLLIIIIIWSTIAMILIS
jgi:hypothetical protein